MRSGVNRVLGKFGYEIHRVRPSWPEDFGAAEIELYREVGPYTMTSPEAVYALVNAVRYVVSNEIPGAIVECGVWRGGSMLAVARTLLELGVTDRDLYLFDTFEGMPEPTMKDVRLSGERAADLLGGEDRSTSEMWAYAALDEVRRRMVSTTYPESLLHFVQGRVENTLPTAAPDSIALLRLDTDWYESTKHELVHLFPRLATGGVLIIDDYGWWRGAREATDEYVRVHGVKLLLNRVDSCGPRIAVKL